jgi:hypothetical protein
MPMPQENWWLPVLVGVNATVVVLKGGRKV